MLVLGISEQHDSHACLIKDGNLIGCIAEERLSRIKSDSGFPRLAIESLMKYCNVNYKNID
mgnify:FL=1